MKKAHQLFRYLSFTLIIAGLSVNNVIHAQIANEIISDINWQESGMGDNADYIYTGEKFNVGLGDNLTNLANTITFETTPEKQEQSWLSLFSDNEKSFSMTLLDANKFDPLNDQIDYSQNIDNKINEINKQESSLVNQTKTLIENLTNSQTIDSQINFSDTADKIVYQNVLQDIDSEYILLDSGVKENIIIKGASPDPVNTFYYELKLDNGIKYYSTNDTNPFNLPENTYYFTDNDGNYLAHFLPIYVYDSNHQVASSDQISFTLVPTANQNIYQIKIQIDFNWIIDSARQYPIIIDPTIVHNTNADFSAGMAMNRMNLNDNVLSIAQMPAAKDPSVVGLWHMDEESGNSVVDYSGNNNNGTSVNTTIADGKFDHARNFNGTSSYLTIPNSNNINFAYNQNFSVNLWMKVPTTQNNTMDTTNVVFEKWSDSGGYPFVLRMYNQTNSTNNGKLLFARYDGTNNPAIISTKAINDNQYHHISLIKNGTLLSIYIDGTLSNSTTDTTTGTTTNTSALYIGKRNGTNPYYYTGSIDELKISNRALTAEQIKIEAQKKPYGLYDSSVLDLGADFSKYDKISWSEQGVQTGNGETPYSTDGLVAQWNFNETSGTTLYNNAGSCGGTCNATLTNMTTTSQDAATNSGWTANNKKWGDGALMFDGSNDFISISHNSNFNLTNSWTVEAWIKRTGPTTTNSDGSIWKFIVRKGTYNTFGLLYDPTSGKVYSNIYNGSAWKNSTSQSILYVGQWHHIVGTYEKSDSGTLKIFFDGVLENTTTNVGTPSTNTDPLSIIGTSNISSVSTYWPAILDSTRIYSRALGGDEILSNYQAGNIELQTRSGETANPDDGSWEEWKPSGNGTETTLYNGNNLYQYNTTDSGLVSYWPMDELTGSTVGDAKGSNTGTATGTKIIDGKYSKARSFNGSSDYIEIPYNSSFDLTNNFSFSGWIYRTVDSGSYERIVSKSNSADYDYWFQITPSDLFQCGIMKDNANSYDRLSATTIPVGQWTFVSCTYDSSYNWNVYINGVLSNGTATGTGGPARIGNRNLEIGRLNASGTWYYGLNGIIDETRLYNTTISTSQIFNLYQQGISKLGLNNINTKSDQNIKTEGAAAQKISTGLPLIDANTVALWHLDETGGSGAYIKDSSDNSNDGTPTGTTVVDGISGKARSFNGSSDYIDVPDTEIASTNYTLSFWAKPTNTTYLGTESTTGTSCYSNMASNRTVLRANYTNAGSITYAGINVGTNGITVCEHQNSLLPYILVSSQNISDWSYITLVNNNNTISLYINGRYIKNAVNTGKSRYFQNYLIGAYNAGQGSYSGYLDEIKIDNIARTADEIAEAYRMGRDHRLTYSLDTNVDLSNNSKLPFYIAADKPGSYLQTTIGESAFANNEPDSNTVGLWHLEETTGSGAYIKDSSSYGNHGTPAAKTIFDGKIGKAVYGATINMSNEANFRFERTQPFSISGWIKIATLASGRGYQYIFNKRLNTSPYTGYELLVADGSDSAVTGAGILRFGLINNWTTNTLLVQTNNRVDDGQWHYVVATYDGSSSASGVKIYIDGIQTPTTTKYNTLTASIVNSSASPKITTTSYGGVDEVRIDNIARTADDIRQAYEIGQRSHDVTIDFAASLDSGNLISNISDTSFNIDATKKGLSQKGSNIFIGDKIIIKENYDGTEYIAQGIVDSVDITSGAITVSSWDDSSTFPSVGFSVKADVFKWQREYWDLTGIMDDQIDATNRITVRLTDGSEGRNIWLDDFKTASNYLTDPTGSLLNSDPNRYIQYRVISSTTDTLITPSFSNLSLDYSNSSTIITSASSTANYLNNLNQTSFPITCHGVTASEPDLTITCQGSFDQSNWYDIASSQSPLSNVDLTGNADVSGWNNFPSSDGIVTIYARVSDGMHNSNATSFTIEKDSVNPTINSITSVNGYTASPYYDNTDNGSTNIIFTSANDTAGCKWAETDLSYSAMSNNCSSTTNCDVNLTGEGSHQVYLQCADTAGNEMSNSQAINYTIDTIAPTTAPACTPTDNTYFKDSLSVACTTGTGGDLIKYTSNDTSPTISSDQWFDSNISATSNFKLISCDYAGNCFDVYSQYNYYQDNIPPVAPTMNNEPQYTAGLNNTVSSNIVSDDGVGGVQYEFCADTSRSMNINIALNKTATASSYGSQYPSLAVNNNINDFWGSGGYPPAWIRIDLGSEQNFNQLKLLPEGSPTGTVYYHIQGSNDGSNFTTIISNATANTYGPTWSTHNFSMQSYRYVRIYCNNWASSWVGIREIEIYNTSDRPTNSCVSSGWLENPNNTFENLVDSTKYYYFVRSKDSLDNISAWSTSVNSIQDNVAPTITGIDSVAGDTIAPFADKTDDGNTVVNFSGSGDIADCYWDTNDVSYEEMTNLCTTTSSCTLNQTGEGTQTAYIRCSDIAGNTMNSSYVVNYAIDTVAPTTAPTCTPANNTYFTNELAISCSTGLGGTTVRYTNNGNNPTDSSPFWENDLTVTANTTFKLISCDDANNCYLTPSIYTYTQDTTPPPTPVMNSEPTYSAGTSNQVTSTTVTDAGTGGVQYQFCQNTNNSTENCTNSNWSDTPSYTFTNLSHDTKYYFFVRSRDNLQNTSTWSSSVSSTQDNIAPTITSITDIAGDTTSPYLDSSDDGNTVAHFISSPDTDTCKWATVDVSYDLMIHTCSSTNTCTFNLSGPSTKNIYLRCRDIAGNYMTSSTLFMYDIDVAPIINSITYVEDDASAPYYDLTDNGDTSIIFGASLDAAACRWDTSDVDYNNMTNNCGSTNECTVNLTGQGAKTIYLRCIDSQNQSTVNSFQVDYTIDSIAPTSAPICTPDSQIFGDSIAVSCTPGADADYIRYTSDRNDVPDNTSSIWSDQTIYFTTQLQLISCDNANNCNLSSSIYDYTRDNTPPPTPIMVAEPAYTRGTSNTIRSSIVTDSGIGGTIEYQFGWNNTGSSSSITNTSDWTTDPSAIFGPLSDNTYYFFVRARDVLTNTSSWSTPVSSIQDNQAATLNSISSVDGDSTPNEWGDNTDDAYTDVRYSTDPDVSDCKWSETDQSYTAMPNTCNSVNYCIINLTGEGEHHVYLRCADRAGNADSVSYNLKYFIDTAPPTSKPTCSATGLVNGYFNTGVAVQCTPGTGGDEVRYTTNNTDPTWQSTLWTDHNFNQTTTLKAISCDWANNCLDEVETQTYTQDQTPPPLPVMNSEPSYTSGLTNTVSASTVNDVNPGVGLITYQFRLKYLDGSNWTESTTGWLDNPEYTFTNLTHGQTYYYAVRAKDGLDNLPTDNAWSGEVSSTQDNNYPMVTGVSYVVDDYDLPFVDESDDSNTLIGYSTSDSPTNCRWSDIDQNYSDMPHTCSSTNSCTLTLNSIGDKTIYLRCIDAAGNTSPSSYQLNYRIDPDGDGTPPQITNIISVANDNTSPYYDTTDDNQTIAIFSSTTDATTCRWGTSDNSYNNLPNTCTDTGQCTFDLAGNSAKQIYMRCIDAAGNRQRSSYVLNYYIDSQVPSATLVNIAGDTVSPYYDNTDNNQTIVTINSTDNLSGVQNCRWDETDQSYTSMSHNCVSNSQCDLNTFAGEGAHTGYIRCIDNVGNIMLSSLIVSFTIDQTEPTITGTTAVAGDNSAPYYDRTNNSNTSVDFTSNDNIAGVVDCRWSTSDTSYDNMGVYGEHDSFYARSCTSSHCNIGTDINHASFWGEGNHTIYLRCLDAAGNRMSSSYVIDLTIDSIPPSANSIISIENDLTAPYFDYTNDSQTIINYSASDNVLGIAACRWDTNNVGYASMNHNCDINTSTCNIDESGQGWHNVYLRCTDLAGNVDQYPYYASDGQFLENISVPALSASYYIDTAAPNIVIDSVNGNTNPVHYNDNTDNAYTEIHLHQVTALDNNTTAEDVVECKWDTTDQTYDQMTHTCNDINNCVSDLTGEGAKTIYLRCRDTQNNITDAYQLNYNIDLTKPTINNLISVAGDTSAPYYDTKSDDTYFNGGWHNLSIANFSSQDNLSGIQTCRWSVADTDYNSMTNNCESATSCAVNLDTQGNHDIYIKCADWAGNPMTDSLHYSYVYDTVGPVITINMVENDPIAPYFDYTDNANTAIDFEVNDATLDVVGCKWDRNSLSYSSMANTCDNLGLCIFNMQNEEAHTGYISCSDQGGNYTNQAVNYWIDTRAPIITQIVSVAGDTTANDYNDNTDNGDTLVVFRTLAEDTAECKWSQNNLAYDSMSNTCEDTDHCQINLTGNSKKTVYLRCKDQQNQKAISAYTLNYNVDSTPPTINSVISVAGDYSSPYFDPNSDFITPINFLSSDNVSGIASCNYYSADHQFGYGCDSTGQCTIREFPGINNEYGDHIAYLRCTDYAGNTMTTDYQVPYTTDYRGPDISLISIAEDTTAPYYDTSDDGNTIVSISTSDTAGTTACRWGINPDPEHLSDYKPTYAQLENICESTEQCTLYLMSQGTKTIYMRCIDVLGNTTGNDTTGNPPFIFNYTIDSSSDGTPPSITKINSVAGDPSSIYYDNTDDGTTVVSFQASGDTHDCKWDTANLSYDNMSNTCSTTSSCNLNLTGEGTKKVYFKCMDNAGNQAILPYILRYTIDTTAPTITNIVTLASDPTAPYIDNTDDDNSTIVYHTDDDAISCKWSTINQNYTTMPNTCTSTGQCQFNLSGLGDKTVYLRCLDAAGNTANTSYVVNYTIDPIADGTPPSILSITSVAGDTSSPYYDSTDNSDTFVKYTASTDAVTCKWNTVDVPYEEMQNFCESTTNCTLTVSGRGAKTVYLRCKDTAGNLAPTSYTLDYIIETMTPRITAIDSVGGDPDYTYLDQTDDGQTLVNYQTSTGTTECKWDTIDTYYDNMSNTCQSTTQCLLNLTGSGNHKVYFRCKNSADMKSDISFKLLYDIANPVSETGLSTISAEIKDSVPHHPNIITVYYQNGITSSVTDGSVKLVLSDEFDLSALTKEDVIAIGGDVEWTNNEIITANGIQLSRVKSIFPAFLRPQIALADGENSIVFPYFGNLDNQDGNLQFIIGNANQIFNPLVPGTYNVTVEVYDSNGELVEEKEALIAIAEEVNVTASVPSSLTFSVEPVANGTVNNSVITTSSTTGDNANFGVFTAADDRIIAHDLIVSTNATNGYLVTTQSIGDFVSNDNIITDFTGTNDSPVSWISPPGSGIESYFGYTTDDSSLHNSSTDRFTSSGGNKWASFNNIPSEVAYSADPVSNEITRIGYRLAITNLQPAGTYETEVMYIATPTF